MAYVLGKDWRIAIGDGVTPTEGFDLLGGEGSFDWQRQSDEIDLSSKDDAVYKSGTYGLQAITFSVTGKVKLPDAAFERVDVIAKSGDPTLTIQIIDTLNSDLVKFEGTVGIGNFSSSFPNDGPATYSFSMKNVGAPTIDDIGIAS